MMEEKDEKLAAEMDYCRGALKSAWEFVTNACPEAATYDGPTYT